MLAAGAPLTVSLNGQVQAGLISSLTPGDVSSEVGAALAEIPLQVLALHITTPDLAAELASGQILYYTYSATVTVVDGGNSYANDADLASIVAHAFFSVTGSYPSSVSQFEGASPVVNTGSVSVTGPLSGLGSTLSAIGSSVQTDILVIAALAALVLVLVLAHPKTLGAFE